MILRSVEPVYMKDYGESPSQFKRSLIQTGQIFGAPGQSIPNGSEFKSPDQFRPNGSRPGKSLATCKDRVKVLSEFKLNGSKIWVGQMSLNRTGQKFGDPMGV